MSETKDNIVEILTKYRNDLEDDFSIKDLDRFLDKMSERYEVTKQEVMDVKGNALTMHEVDECLSVDTEYLVCDVWAARKLHSMYGGSFVDLILVIMNSETGRGIFVHAKPESDLLFCKKVDGKEVVLAKICNYSRSM